MRVRAEKCLKDEGTTSRYRHLSSLKSGLESSTYMCVRVCVCVYVCVCVVCVVCGVVRCDVV